MPMALSSSTVCLPLSLCWSLFNFFPSLLSVFIPEILFIAMVTLQQSLWPVTGTWGLFSYFPLV